MIAGFDEQRAAAGRARRDAWLSAGLFVLALAAFLALVADVFVLTDEGLMLQPYATAMWSLSASGGGLLAAGYLISGVALARRRSMSVSLWRPGMLLIAAAYLIFLGEWVVQLRGIYSSPDVPSIFHSAGYFISVALGMLSDVWRVAAALLLIGLLAGSRDGNTTAAAAQRSRRLGWVMAGGAALSGLATLYWATGLFNLWNGPFVNVNGAGSVDNLFQFAGCTIAAVAFIRAAQRFGESETAAYGRRERLLVVGALALLVYFGLRGGDAFWIGADWRFAVLSGANSAAWTIAALCAVIGFWLSARSASRVRVDCGGRPARATR